MSDDRAGPRPGAGVKTGRSANSACLMPLLMVYYLCCWPQESKSDTSSEHHGSRRGTLGHRSSGHHRTSDFFSRRMASSAVSLHLPSTSGEHKVPLSAHRSHEEIGRRKSHHEPREDSARYHSAPSVIDEVVHRRDWERSTRELHIPLRPDVEEALSGSSAASPDAPRAEPEISDIDEHSTDLQIIGRTCKKHYTNIKSSKGKKERHVDDDKDCDATETSNFYIGDNDCSTSITNSPRNDANTSVMNSPKIECGSSTVSSSVNSPRREESIQPKMTYRGKEVKQSLNESIRSKERPKQTLVPLEEHQTRTFGFCLDDVIEQLESLDRSGAMHHTIESRISLSKPPFPPPSVEAVGYEGYLPPRGRTPPHACPAAPAAPPPGGMRARHASDGDILAPPLRPESGAFSESDLDLDLELEESEQPPPYDQLRHSPAAHTRIDRKETAI